MSEKVSGYNKSIVGLKGIAALVVFFSHSLCIFNSDFINSLYFSPAHLLFDGKCAVAIFFAISGFFYYRNFKLSFSSYMRFIWKKVIRIYPGFIMAMLIALAFFAFRTQFDVTLISDWGNSFWNNGIDPITFIKQLTILIPTDPNILNPPIWYLEWEVKMFIILPLLIPIANRINYKGFPWYVLLLIPIMIYGKGIIPISYMLGYLFGWINSNMDNKWKQIIIRYAFVWVLIGLICLNVSNEVNLPEGLSSFIRVLGACVIVFIVYNVGDSFLASKPILFLGNVSYEFYLIHFPVLLFFRRIVCVPIAYMLITFSVSIISAVIINSLCKNLSGRLIK